MIDIQRMKKNWVKLKENRKSVQHVPESSKDENDHKMLLQINDELAKISDRLEKCATTKVLRQEFRMINDAFVNLNLQLAQQFIEKFKGDCE